MLYRNAKKLHNEDAVIRKSDNCSLIVCSVKVMEKDIFLTCDDGNIYHHKEVK